MSRVKNLSKHYNATAIRADERLAACIAALFNHADHHRVKELTPHRPRAEAIEEIATRIPEYAAEHLSPIAGRQAGCVDGGKQTRFVRLPLIRELISLQSVSVQKERSHLPLA